MSTSRGDPMGSWLHIVTKATLHWEGMWPSGYRKRPAEYDPKESMDIYVQKIASIPISSPGKMQLELQKYNNSLNIYIYKQHIYTV
jgi:hypothetical protein